MTIVANWIELNGGTAAAPTLDDGEPYIDEANSALRFKTLGGVVELPLARQPAPALSGASSDLCVQMGGALAFLPETQGGGGAVLDDQPWRVPGAIARAVRVSTVQDVVQCPFTVSKPMHVTALRLERVSAGTVNFGVTDAAGMVLTTSTPDAVDPGVLLASVDLVLAPGRYFARVQASGVDVRGMDVDTDQGRAFAPFALQVTYAA